MSAKAAWLILQYFMYYYDLKISNEKRSIIYQEGIPFTANERLTVSALSLIHFLLLLLLLLIYLFIYVRIFYDFYLIYS